ncbi:MAG: hypothetical protein ACK5KL_01000 [Dysgonomonas sp.]
MFENKFLRMLFDYRGTISRRQYWGSLLFLLILLSTSNLIYRWEFLGTLLGVDRGDSIQSYNFDAYLFLTYLSNAFITILYFSSIAVAISLIVVTLKRSKTLGYSKVSSWLFAIITYLAYFSLNALSNYYQYKSNSHRYNEVSDTANIEMVIPIGLVIIGFLIAFTIIIVILLSRQTEVDSEEDVDYYGYDSINCIFGLMKFSITYTIIIICWKFALSWMIDQSLLLTKLLALALIISYVYFYLNIFVKRSRDARVNSAYIICAFFLLIIIIGLYIFAGATYLFDGKPLFGFFSNKICFILINLYVISTYVLIALPSKQIEYVDPD